MCIVYNVLYTDVSMTKYIRSWIRHWYLTGWQKSVNRNMHQRSDLVFLELVFDQVLVASEVPLTVSTVVTEPRGFHGQHGKPVGFLARIVGKESWPEKNTDNIFYNCLVTYFKRLHTTICLKCYNEQNKQSCHNKVKLCTTNSFFASILNFYTKHSWLFPTFWINA